MDSDGESEKMHLTTINVNGDTVPASEEHFRRIHNFKTAKKQPFWNKVRSKVKLRDLSPLQFFPILSWIRGYKIKEDLPGDVTAGLTCSVLQIPHALAFAPLAGQAPVVGLYMAIFPPLVYVLMGTSRHLSLGIFAILMMMVGKVVSDNASEDGYSALEIGTAITFVAGLWQLVCGGLRLGFLCVLLSQSLVSGFTCAASVHIELLQIKYILGIEIISISGPFKVVYTAIEYCKKIPETNLVALGMSCVTIIILYVYNEIIKPKVAKKTKIPIPVEFLMICITTAISFCLELDSKHELAIVGDLPPGLPTFVIPHFIPKLLFDGFVIAIVNISVNISLGSVFAKKGGYTLNNNQEFLAIGATNVFGSFLQSVPACGSISRTSVQYTVGGKTQLASAVSSIVGILFLMFASKPLGLIPMCVLASIVFVTLRTVLVQITDVPKIWRREKSDAVIWVVTFLCVTFLDIALGISIGLIVSLLIVILRSVKTEISVLGRLPNEDTYVEAKYYDTQSNVLILKINGCLNFVNCSTVSLKLKNKISEYLELEKLIYSRYIILEFGAVTYVDASAVEEICNFYDDVKTSNCDLIVTNCNYNVYKTFEGCDLFSKFPKDHVMISINDATAYLRTLGVL